jgi:nucleoside-diphosphate-sugar epimerase
MKILVTGAGGFVGSALCPALEARGHAVRAAARRPLDRPDARVVDDIGPDTDWRDALHGCDAVVHLAAMVHVMGAADASTLASYRRVNAAGTRALAEQALLAGVRRFVFVSTAKVLGEASPTGRPFTDADADRPLDPYAISKAEAERALDEASDGTQMRVAILRPPLVYGPGVGANFLRLFEAVARGRPLPFGAVANRRSLVYVGNLASAIAACLEHPEARGRYLVCDGQDVSTAALVQRIGHALGRSPRLVAVPVGVLRAAGALFNRRADMDRLLGDFALAPTRLAALGWRAGFSLDDGLAATAEWFRASRAEGGGAR